MKKKSKKKKEHASVLLLLTMANLFASVYKLVYDTTSWFFMGVPARDASLFSSLASLYMAVIIARLRKQNAYNTWCAWRVCMICEGGCPRERAFEGGVRALSACVGGVRRAVLACGCVHAIFEEL